MCKPSLLAFSFAQVKEKNMQRKLFVLFAGLVLFSLLIAPTGMADAQAKTQASARMPRSAATATLLTDDPSPPTQTVKLIFIHHSHRRQLAGR